MISLFLTWMVTWTLLAHAEETLAPCAGELTPIRVTEVGSTRVSTAPASDLVDGWLRIGSDVYLSLTDLSTHARPPAGLTHTLEGRAYRTLGRSERGAYTVLYGSPLSPPRLARTGLIEFGLTRPLEQAGKFARAEDFAFSPDERSLALKGPHAVWFVNTEDGRARTGVTMDPEVSIDSRWAGSRLHLVAAFAERASFFFFDVPTSSSDLLFRIARRGKRTIDPIAYLERTHRIAFADETTLHLLNERGEGREVEFPESIEGLLVAPDGHRFVAYGRRHVRAYDAFDLGSWGQVPPSTADLTLVRFAPDGDVVRVDVEGRVVKYRLSE